MEKKNVEMISSITRRLEELERNNMKLKQQNEQLKNLFREYAKALDSLMQTISFNANNEKLFHFTNISTLDESFERIFESYGYQWFIRVLPNANNQVLVYLHTKEHKSFHVRFSIRTFLSSGKREEASTQMIIAPQTERVGFTISHEKLGWNAAKNKNLTILVKIHWCSEIKE